MTCREVAEFLMDYLDGALLREPLDVFEAHLAVCRECRDYLKSYQVAVELARMTMHSGGDAANPLPPELIAAVLAARKAQASDRPGVGDA